MRAPCWGRRFGHDAANRLRTLRRDITSLQDHQKHLDDNVQFLLDATLGFINIQQNNVMKVLTVASVVGIPPTLLAGIWGMNFKDMPELGLPHAYRLRLDRDHRQRPPAAGSGSAAGAGSRASKR